MKRKDMSHDERKLTRRNFLKKSSLATLFGVTGGVEIVAERPAERRSERRAEAMNVGLIGFGAWGREIAATLARIPEVRLAAVCDVYDVMLRRAERAAPDAARLTDYRAVLDDPDVHAVVVATPTHTHRAIAGAALDAGKHVYCEAPMAATVDDARALARAARDASDLIFHVGQQFRADPQYLSVSKFIRGGALGKAVMTRAQWHTKQSWRRTSPNRERERALNWRLDPSVSLGLVGEAGIHQIDTALWFLGARPTAATGFGQIMLWDDGRTVPDTVQSILAFPNGVHMIFDATLTSSFDGQYDLFYGSESTIMMRESKAWMFKEVDAPMLGWEVYARRDKFYKEEGIALLANATKLDAQDLGPTDPIPGAETPLFYALKEFVDNFFFGPFEPSAGYREGFDAAVVAIKANEAIAANTRLDLDPALFDPG
jgi:predicted dehydrogenase